MSNIECGTSQRIKTSKGEFKTGHKHEDGGEAACIIQSGSNANHYISLDSSGVKKHRNNGTMCMSPGSFQVQAGRSTSNEDPGIFFEAENGDIIIKSKSGKIVLDAVSIEILAKRGFDGSNGNVTIEANETIKMNSQKIDIKTNITSIVSDNTIEITSKSVLNCYGTLIEFAEGGSTLVGPLFGSKPGPSLFETKMIKTLSEN